MKGLESECVVVRLPTHPVFAGVNAWIIKLLFSVNILEGHSKNLRF